MLPDQLEGSPPAHPKTYRYFSRELSLSLGQGTFEIIPDPPVTLMEALDYLGLSPNDKFMWNALPQAKPEDLPQLVAKLKDHPTPAILKCLIPYLGQAAYPDVSQAVMEIGSEHLKQMTDAFPTLNARVRTGNYPHMEIEDAWKDIRRQNREYLVPLGQMSNSLSVPVPRDLMPDESQKAVYPAAAIKGVYDEYVDPKETGHAVSGNTGTSLRDIPLTDTVDKLSENHFLNGAVPNDHIVGRRFCGTYAAGVPWKIDWRVSLDRANYRVTGMGGCSGKGTSHEATFASAFMELAERISAVAGATPDWPHGYENIDRIILGRQSELSDKGYRTVDPWAFFPPAPYKDPVIYWVNGILRNRKGFSEEVWVPAQKAFHFSNLDEPEIVRDSSNALAAGNTPEEARLHADFEVIERDGCYTTFTSPDRIFRLHPDTNSQTGQIIAEYQARGLHAAFIDITTDLGVPAYKAFIQLPSGMILSGSGAHLDGVIALNRAICELSAKCIGYSTGGGNLASIGTNIFHSQERNLADIPNLSTGDVKTDLRIVETVLALNGYPVTYVDLTHRAVNIPVVRAIIPGLDSPFTLTRREVKHFLEANRR